MLTGYTFNNEHDNDNNNYNNKLIYQYKFDKATTTTSS